MAWRVGVAGDNVDGCVTSAGIDEIEHAAAAMIVVVGGGGGGGGNGGTLVVSVVVRVLDSGGRGDR